MESVGEDDLDFYLKNLKKQFTKLTKKLVEIEELEKKKSLGEALQDNQVEKISKKGELLEKRLQLDEMGKNYQ